MAAEAWHLVTGTWAARYNGSLEARPSMQAYRHACDPSGALAIGKTLSRHIGSAASGFVSVLGVDDCAAGDDTLQRDLLQTSSALKPKVQILDSAAYNHHRGVDLCGVAIYMRGPDLRELSSSGEQRRTRGMKSWRLGAYVL